MSQSFYLEAANSIAFRTGFGRLVQPLTHHEFTFKKDKPSLWKRIKAFFSKKPKPLATEALTEIAPNVTMYTSYSGADITVSIGTEVIAEMQEISFQKINPLLADELAIHSTYADRNLLLEYPVVIVATYALFDKEPIRGFDGIEEMDITLTFANEYGQSSFQSLVGARVISIIGGSSIDDITQERRVVMCARNVFPLEKNE